ncbi:hypothetical protein [Gimesia sp.]|uniref:hypothetical protein n=1 Tax=Gimesia sp. TaxID=2024833 RepID=UPI003A95B93F
MHTDKHSDRDKTHETDESQIIDSPDTQEATIQKSQSNGRSMVRSALMGGHTHETGVGVNVHIWERNGKKIARGRYEKRAFGETLGADPQEAKSKLIQLLHKLESGSFVHPSEARKQILKTKKIPNLILRELMNRFLSEKRKLRGKTTANTYLNRLTPVLDFVELIRSRKKWPTAQSLDRDFAIELREFLINRQVTRNGSANASTKPMSLRQIQNCLETLRMALKWACRADVRNLPPEFVNPISPDIIGSTPPKDPLRKSKIPLNRRIELLNAMDDWQFMSLCILLVLPIRFEDVSGLIISDVDFEKQQIRFGSRFSGSDFNKGKVTVEIPLPKELMPLLRMSQCGRSEGPFFLNRKYGKRKLSNKHLFNTASELKRRFQEKLLKAPKGTVQNEQDQKQTFRDLLKELGGISSAYIGKQLRQVIGKDESSRPYDLRGSITQEMKEAGVSFLDLRYLTEHTVKDILNDYTGLNPEQEIVKYYNKISPLLEAIKARTEQLHLSEISTCQSCFNAVQDTLPEGGQDV